MLLQTLFVLGFEKSVRKLVDAAEEALEVLAERDRLIAEQQEQCNHAQGSPSGSHAESSEHRLGRIAARNPDQSV